MTTNTKHQWLPMTVQSLATIIFLSLVLFALNTVGKSEVVWAVGAGSLASSCFLVFGRPHARGAQPKRIVGGYLIGVITGELIHFTITRFTFFQHVFFGSPHFQAIAVLAAIAVGVSLILMVLLHVEHPPAAGMALVLVLDVHDYHVLTVIVVASLVLALIRWGFGRFMVNLT